MAVTKAITLPAGAETPDLEHGSVLFIGTATTLIRYAGFTILTDPNFLHAGDHAHLGYGLTAARQTNPAIEIEALPRLDLCILSHLHGDHWDRVAREKLPKALPIITTPHAAAGLRQQGFIMPQALETWETCTATKGDAWLRVTAMPGRHGPPVVHRLLPPVMGSLLEWGWAEGTPRFRLYISGDTLVWDELKKIPQRYPHIHLALLHLGGTRVLGILVTMGAEQGIRCLRIIQPKAAIPIHYNDYAVFKSPLADFKQAAAEAGLPTELHYLNHGDAYTFNVPAD